MSVKARLLRLENSISWRDCLPAGWTAEMADAYFESWVQAILKLAEDVPLESLNTENLDALLEERGLLPCVPGRLAGQT